MTGSRFDNLARTLGRTTSRRDTVKVLVGAALGGLALHFGRSPALADNGNRANAHFCAAVFGAETPAAEQCTADATRGTGLSQSCGNASPSSICCTRNARGFCVSYSGASCPCPTGQGCCNGACAPLSTLTNCGHCGNTCPAPANGTAVCMNGICTTTCNAGFTLCNGSCVANCTSGQLLNSTCQCVCPGGMTLCGGVCTWTQSDNNNCGTCGTVCPSGSRLCLNGTCATGAGSICVALNVRCPTDQCKTGWCDIADPNGSCVITYAPNGTVCDQFLSNACTVSGVCMNGTCVGVPKTCPAGQTCNQATGQCS